MSQRVTAIYENGVLRLLSPLELPEHSQVEIDIHHVTTIKNRLAHRDQVRQTLVAAGLSLSIPEAITHDSSPLSAERREELARLFSADRPLSELISEDRKGR